MTTRRLQLHAGRSLATSLANAPSENRTLDLSKTTSATSETDVHTKPLDHTCQVILDSLYSDMLVYKPLNYISLHNTIVRSVYFYVNECNNDITNNRHPVTIMVYHGMASYVSTRFWPHVLTVAKTSIT